jgi:hypothetical protein
MANNPRGQARMRVLRVPIIALEALNNPDIYIRIMCTMYYMSPHFASPKTARSARVRYSVCVRYSINACHLRAVQRLIEIGQASSLHVCWVTFV